MVYLQDYGDKWQVVISDDLTFSGKIDFLNKKKNVRRFWGEDELGNEYTMQVYYPKKFFPSKEYMEKIILPKFKECPNCKIENLKLLYKEDKFKYIKKDNKKYLSKPFKGKKNMMAKTLNWLKTNPEFTGQGIAQLPKTAISLLTTDLGSKIINTAVGAVGALINEKTVKNKFARSAFWNMFWTFADPTARQVRSITSSWNDLIMGARMKNFGTAFGGIIENPQEVVSAIKGAMPHFGGAFKSFRRKIGNGTYLKNIPEEVIPPVTDKLTSTFRGKEGMTTY